MTTIRFYRRGGLIEGFSILGHAGYAPAGEDIVCSAVSATSHMAMLGIEKILGVPCKTRVDERRGRMTLTVGDPVRAQPFLRALEEEALEIYRQYPDCIRVFFEERREKVCSV